MRKKIFLNFLLVVILAWGSVNTSFGQNTPVTLDLRNVTLEKVLDEIEKQTDYLFVYNQNVNVARNISVTAERRNLREVLSEIFNGSDVGFSVEGNNIMLSSRPAVQQTERTVTGTVRDSNGTPVIGATVMVTGTMTGTTTDARGNFSLRIGPGAETLRVSYLGMETKDVIIGSSSTFDIVLDEGSIRVTEVVVTALGLTKEAKSLSYNVQTIGSDDLTTVKDANFVNSLMGKVAGLQINPGSSGIGGSARVVLRGTKSISGNNNALYVIDGIPMINPAGTEADGDIYSGAGQSGDGIASLNPEDIESMSILSGPAAAALYGNDGANGAILITTKKGEKDSFVVTYSNNTSFYSPFKMHQFQNTYGLTEPGSYYSWGDKLETKSSYNPKDFFQTGYNTTNSASVSMGGEKNQTYISVSSVNAEGIIDNNKLDRYNATIRNTFNHLDGRLVVDAGFMYSKTNEQNMVAQGQYSNPIVPIYLFPPGDDIEKYKVFERYDAERFIKTQFWPFGDLGYGMQNPWWITRRNLFENEKDRYQLTGQVRFNILDWLSVSGRVKMDNNHAVYERKYYASTYTVLASDNGFYSRQNIDTKQTYADFIVSIDRTFRDDQFSLNANLGTSINDVRHINTTHSGNLLDIGAGVANQFTYENISQTAGDFKYLSEGYHDQLQAIFATAQLGYKGMAYLDLSGRIDWPSQLAFTDHSSYFYPSIGLSGVVNEIFDIRSRAFSFLKIRGSYSEVGNPPERFISQLTYSQPSGTLPNQITDMPFPIKPERTKSWELGFDLNLWGTKVQLSSTFYHSATYNQLIHGTLSAAQGYTGFYLNTGKVTNKGIEASLSLRQPLGPVLWNSSLVFSLNRNKINQLITPGQKDPFGEDINMERIDLGGNTTYRMYLTEGGTMADLYVNGLRTDEHGYIYVNPINSSIQASTEGPEIYAGRMTPDYTLSWRNGFSWKGIDVDFLINARVGGVALSLTQAAMDGFGVSKASAVARDNGGAWVNGYQIPAYNYYSIAGSGSGVGSEYIYDATNIRLGELTVGYRIPLPEKVTKYVKGVNVSFVARNLCMIYCKAPYDPEVTSTTGTYFTGIDYFMQPSLRSLGFSVKLTF